MGAYLSAPRTEKETEAGENDFFSYGVSSMQGWRTDQEDAHAAVLEVNDARTAIFAVFDGHGGREVSKFCAAHLPQELSQANGFSAGDVERALAETFLHMDELLVKDEFREELKAFKGSDSDEEKESAPMVINGASLPDSLLEALGLQAGAGSGFQIKLVRSGPGGRQIAIDDIEGEEEEEEEELQHGKDDEEAAAKAREGIEAGQGRAGAEPEAEPEARRSGSESSESGDRSSKRKREDMQVDRHPQDEAGVEEAAVASGENASDDSEAVVEMVQEVIEDAELSTPPGDDDYAGPSAGCTAVCAVVRGNELFVANAGDSRCVLCRNGVAVAMTTDHKPTDAEEYDRIIKAGGFVADGRVNGSLNLSRAIGDLEYKQSKELGPGKQMVTAMPEIRKETLSPGDSFLILACDGIWDVLSNQEAVDFVQERLLAGKSPKQICEEVCDHCLAPDTAGCGKGCDNMSIQVVVLKPFASELLAKASAAAAAAAMPAAQ